MEIIIEFDKNIGSLEFSREKSVNNISIGKKNENYYLIYQEDKYRIDEKEVNALIAILDNVNISAPQKFGIECEGETYSIILKNGSSSVEFKWSSYNRGKQWESLFSFKDMIIKLKEDYILRKENFLKLEEEFIESVYGKDELEEINGKSFNSIFKNNSVEICYEDMKFYVLNNSKYKLTQNQFEEIEVVFREKWNSMAGEFACRTDFIQYVYDKITLQGNFIMQDIVEDTITKILDYMESIGQYTGFSDN